MPAWLAAIAPIMSSGHRRYEATTLARAAAVARGWTGEMPPPASRPDPVLAPGPPYDDWPSERTNAIPVRVLETEGCPVAIEHAFTPADPTGVEAGHETTTLPYITLHNLTGRRVVHRIVTELGVLDVRPGKPLLLVERAPGLDVAEIRSKTAAPIEIAPDVREMRFA